MHRLVEADFVYKKANDIAEVYGKIFFREEKGKLYAPEQILITHGTIDLDHRKNNGLSSKRMRDQKERIIKERCECTSNLFAEIVFPFVIKTKGLVGLTSVLSGANSNYNSDLRLKDSSLSKFKAAKLFENLDSHKNPKKISETISMKDFIEQNKKYILKLKSDYNKTILSATRS